MSKMPDLLELVLVFRDNSMVCHIDSPKIGEIGDLIEKCWKDSIENGKMSIVNINSISGKCMFAVHLLLGFYFRPANKAANDEFHKHLINIAERHANAAEKIARQCDHGDDWKV